MERITITQLGNAVTILNGLLPPGTYLTVSGRNGGYGLDHCYRDEHGQERVRGTLVFGTKREVYDYVRAMREGILLSLGR
jgi:hypothetical protein